MAHKLFVRALLRLVAALTLSAAMLSSAAPLEKWHWRSPLPQGNPLRSVAYGNGLYVAVGDLGTILTSPDGTNWVRQTSGTTSALRDCIYRAGQWVVVGDFGTVLTSPDARLWTAEYAGTFFSLDAVTYGNGQFVAVGNAMTIVTSSDAKSWISRSSGPMDLFDVIYEDDICVAVGGNRGSANTAAAGIIVSSADAVSWTRREAFPDAAVVSIAYGDGKFVAAVQNSYRLTPALWISNDGQSWEPRTINVNHWPDARIGFGNGVWVLAGSGIDTVYFDTGAISISTNLQTWSQVVSNTAATSAIVHAQGQFVMSRTDGTIFVSENGSTWTNPLGNFPPFSFYDAEYVNGQWLATSSDRLLGSPDASVWTNIALFTNGNISFLAHNTGTYVVGGSDQLWTSSDLVAWTNTTPVLPDSFSPNLGDLTFGGDLFVGISSFTQGVFTSPDGTNWSRGWLAEPGADIPLQAIAYGNGRFVAVGAEALATSLDATNWHVVQTNFINMWAVTSGNGRFVAVGPYGSMMTTDGTNWVKQSVPDFGAFSVAFGGGFFVAAGTQDPYGRLEAPIWISTDGLNWTRRNSHTGRSLRHVTFGDGTFVIGGTTGVVLQSDPIVNLELQMNSDPQLILSGPTRRSYRIEYADSPHGPWHLMRTVFMDSSSMSFSDPSTASPRFYRAHVLP